MRSPFNTISRHCKDVWIQQRLVCLKGYSELFIPESLWKSILTSSSILCEEGAKCSEPQGLTGGFLFLKQEYSPLHVFT